MISAKARYTTLDVAFGSMTNACASRDLIKSPLLAARKATLVSASAATQFAANTFRIAVQSLLACALRHAFSYE